MWRMENAHARAEVIARDTQANTGYAPHTSQFRARENICIKNWVRIGPNSWNSLTKLFALRDSAAKQAVLSHNYDV